jgi:hypothetical protein
MMVMVMLMTPWVVGCDAEKVDKPDSGEEADNTDTQGPVSDKSTDTSNSPGSCVQDYAGHDECRSLHGPAYFCSQANECVEASGCEAESCCLPGEMGDGTCQATFGECSVCVPGLTDGGCNPKECFE